MNTVQYQSTPLLLNGYASLSLLMMLMVMCMPMQAQLTHDQTIEVIRDAGNYTSGVAINPKGFTNGDYNIYEKRWYLRDPFWRTGQAVTALWEGFEILKHPRFKLAAERSTEWMKTQESTPLDESGSFVAAIRKEKGREFVMTSHMMRGLPGLFSSWHQTGDSAAREFALRVVSYYFQKGYTDRSGIWYDYLDLNTGEPLTKEDPFYRAIANISFEKIAHPHIEGSIFLEAYRETGNEAYKRAFIAQCDQLIATQEGGLWPKWGETDRTSDYKELSFDLWYADALLDGYKFTGNQRYLQAAKEAADVYIGLAEDDGTFYQPGQDVIGGDAPALDGLTVAYLGLVMIRLQQEGMSGYQDQIDLTAQWLYDHRYDSYHKNVNLRRATMSQRQSRNKGIKTRVNEDIGTVFSLRFLCAYYHLRFD